MVTQEAEHRLESIVPGHHMYKYSWTPCLPEQLSIQVDVKNVHELVSYYAVSEIKYTRF